MNILTQNAFTTIGLTCSHVALGVNQNQSCVRNTVTINNKNMKIDEMKKRTILRRNNEIIVTAEDAALAEGRFQKEGMLYLNDIQCNSVNDIQSYTMFKVIMQKHVIHDTSWWEVWYAKHCSVYHWERKNVKLIARLGIFRHTVFLYSIFSKQAVTKVFKVIMQLSFHL